MITQEKADVDSFLADLPALSCFDTYSKIYSVNSKILSLGGADSTPENPPEDLALSAIYGSLHASDVCPPHPDLAVASVVDLADGVYAFYTGKEFFWWSDNSPMVSGVTSLQLVLAELDRRATIGKLATIWPTLSLPRRFCVRIALYLTRRSVLDDVWPTLYSHRMIPVRLAFPDLTQFLAQDKFVQDLDTVASLAYNQAVASKAPKALPVISKQGWKECVTALHADHPEAFQAHLHPGGSTTYSLPVPSFQKKGIDMVAMFLSLVEETSYGALKSPYATLKSAKSLVVPNISDFVPTKPKPNQPSAMFSFSPTEVTEAFCATPPALDALEQAESKAFHTAPGWLGAMELPVKEFKAYWPITNWSTSILLDKVDQEKKALQATPPKTSETPSYKKYNKVVKLTPTQRHIVIFGRAGVGKDTLAQHVMKTYDADLISFADHMKRFVQANFGFSDEQLWGPSELRAQLDLRFLDKQSESWEKALHGVTMNGRAFVRSLFNSPGLHYNEHKEEIYYCSLLAWFRTLYQLPISPRTVLQTLGTEWGRAQDTKIWVRDVGHTIKRLFEAGGARHVQDRGVVTAPTTPQFVVSADGRFLEELNPHSVSVYIKRDLPEQDFQKHASETTQFNLNDFTLVIENNGTPEEMFATFDAMMEKRFG